MCDISTARTILVKKYINTRLVSLATAANCEIHVGSNEVPRKVTRMLAISYISLISFIKKSDRRN